MFDRRADTVKLKLHENGRSAVRYHSHQRRRVGASSGAGSIRYKSSIRLLADRARTGERFCSSRVPSGTET